jgi:hypothetical protein
MNLRTAYGMMLFGLCLSLSGCPRMAHVNMFNNTGVNVTVNIGGNVTEIQPKLSKSVVFSSNTLIVNSSLGEWSYGRSLIPYGGNDGPYFDGTIYVQLNRDGKIYVGKENDERPLVELNLQPEGFPVEPNS